MFYSRKPARVARSIKTKRYRRCFLESLENRSLLAGDFLQGVAFVDANANGVYDTGEGIAGAKIDLTGPSGPLTTTTLADGFYLFTDLAAGNYQLKETPPPGYANAGAQTNLSQLNQVTGSTASTIDVTIGNPDTSPPWLVNYVARNSDTVAFTHAGVSIFANTGQFIINVNETDIGYITPNFSTYCVDIDRSISLGDPPLPYNTQPLQQAIPLPPGTAGRIAYLYNHYGTLMLGDPLPDSLGLGSGQTMNADYAAGLQLAFWQIRSGDIDNINVVGGDQASVLAAYNAFLADAAGENELATFLNGLPTDTRLAGSQGLIATGSLNFNNTPTATVRIVKNTIGGNGTFVFSASGFLSGQGSPAVPNLLSIATVGNTGSSSTFTFTNLPAGGLSLIFNEIVPGGWTFTRLQITGGDADDTVSGAEATLNVEPGENIVVTYTDTQVATVQLQKNSFGGDGVFSFRAGGLLRGTNDIPDLPGITTLGSTGLSNVFTLRNLPEAGLSLSFEENSLLGWIIGNVVVSGDADAIVGLGTALLNINPGESILVTFSNTKQAPPPPPSIVVTADKCNCSNPAVHIVDPTTGTVQNSFLAYEPSYRGGVRVATGDLNGDGIDEIVTAPGRNHSPLVKVFDQSGNLLYSFLPYAKTFTGGVNVAIGDINGDGKNDIITAMSYNGNQVRAYKNTSSGASLAFTAFSSFTPFGTAYKGGAVVVAADLGQPKTAGKAKSLDSSVLDGRAEIIVGNGSGMRSTIKEFTFFGSSSAATLVRTLQPFSPTFRGGISLDVARVNSDLVPDIIVSAGNGGNSQVQVINGATNSVLGGFNAFTPADGTSRNAPVHVAAVDTDGNGIADLIFAVQGTDGTTRRIRKFDALTDQLVDQVIESSADFCGNYFLAPLKSRPAQPT